MEFKALVSSNINGIHYAPEDQVLTVEFSNRSRYKYHDVPEDVYQDFLNAGSPGSFFADNVKGVYRYERAS